MQHNVRLIGTGHGVRKMHKNPLAVKHGSRSRLDRASDPVTECPSAAFSHALNIFVTVRAGVPCLPSRSPAKVRTAVVQAALEIILKMRLAVYHVPVHNGILQNPGKLLSGKIRDILPHPSERLCKIKRVFPLHSLRQHTLKRKPLSQNTGRRLL